MPNPKWLVYFIAVNSSAVPRARSILLGMWCLRLCLKNGRIESNEGHLKEMPTIPEEPVNTSKINGGKRSTHFSKYLKKCFSQLASDFEKENIFKNVPKNVQAGDSIVLGRIDGEVQEKDRKEKEQNSDIIEVTNAFLDLWNLNTQGPGCALVLVKFLRTKVEEGNWTEGNEAVGGAGGGEGEQKIDSEGRDGVQVEKEVEIAEGWKGGGGGSMSMTEADTDAITTQASGSLPLPMPIPVSKPVSAPSSVPVPLSGPVDGVSAVIEALLESLYLCPVTTHPRLLFVISWLLRPPHADADTDTDRDVDTEKERTIDRTTEGNGGKDERMMTTGKEGNVSKIAPTESVVLDLFAVNPYSSNRMNKKSENSAESKRVLSCVLDWLNVRVASLLRVDGSMTYAMLMRKGTVLSLLIVEVCLCLC
jgi:hypothetical protein